MYFLKEKATITITMTKNSAQESELAIRYFEKKNHQRKDSNKDEKNTYKKYRRRNLIKIFDF